MDENTDRDNINFKYYNRSTYTNSYEVNVTYGIGLPLLKLLGDCDRVVPRKGSFSDAHLYRRDRVEEFIEDHQLEWDRQLVKSKRDKDMEIVSTISYAYGVKFCFICSHAVRDVICSCIADELRKVPIEKRLFHLREYFTNYSHAISLIDVRKRCAKYARDIIKRRFNERCHEALVKLEDKNGNK